MKIRFLHVSLCHAHLCSDPLISAVHRMEFVSCPGCKLNKLPEVKRFLKEVIEPGEYPGVTVNFIPGRLPEVRQKVIDTFVVSGITYSLLFQ